MRIAVTADHIARGIPKDPRTCPVALAIRSALPSMKYISVVFSTAFLLRDSMREYEAFLPEEVVIFVDDFDNGLPVFPFEFELDIPAELS
jgi:hypothetical protein